MPSVGNIANEGVDPVSANTIARRRLPNRRPALLTAVLLKGTSMRVLETALAGIAIATALLLGIGH